MSNIGYLRVSCEKQDLKNQEYAIFEYANLNKLSPISFVREEIGSRSKLYHRKIWDLVSNLKAEDNILVYDLTRLARGGLSEIGTILYKITEQKATLHIIQDNLIINDKPDLQAETLLFVLGIAGRIERDLISQRTKAGLAARKKEGVILGRPKGSSIPKDVGKRIHELRQLGLSYKKIGQHTHYSAPTIVKYIRENPITALQQEAH